MMSYDASWFSAGVAPLPLPPLTEHNGMSSDVDQPINWDDFESFLKDIALRDAVSDTPSSMQPEGIQPHITMMPTPPSNPPTTLPDSSTNDLLGPGNEPEITVYREHYEEFVPIPPVAERHVWGKESRMDHMLPFIPVDLACRAEGCIGVPMEDCLVGKNLCSADEYIFMKHARPDVTSIEFVLTWPGYNVKHSFQIPIHNHDRSVWLNRAHLAKIIAGYYKEFIEACEAGHFAFCPKSDGEERFRVGNNEITLDRLKLSSLWHVRDNTWSASIRLVTKSLTQEESDKIYRTEELANLIEEEKGKGDKKGKKGKEKQDSENMEE